MQIEGLLGSPLSEIWHGPMQKSVLYPDHSLVVEFDEDDKVVLVRPSTVTVQTRTDR